MPAREVVGRELRRDAAPRERQARAGHRRDRDAAAERAQHVGKHARHSQTNQHQRDRELLGGVRRAWRRRQRGAEHADQDRAHRQVLVAACALPEQTLADQHQHEQARRQRGLHHDQRREQQREHLQGEAEYRQARADQPAPPLHEAPRERKTQVLLVGRLPRVHRLEGDP